MFHVEHRRALKLSGDTARHFDTQYVSLRLIFVPRGTVNDDPQTRLRMARIMVGRLRNFARLDPWGHSVNVPRGTTRASFPAAQQIATV